MDVLFKPLLGALVLLTCALALPPAQAINKCTALDGKVSFQDKDCPPGRSEVVTLRPDPGAAPPPAPAASKPAATGKPQIIHTGPRGGHYTIDKKGRKRYLPREKGASAGKR